MANVNSVDMGAPAATPDELNDNHTGHAHQSLATSSNGSNATAAVVGGLAQNGTVHLNATGNQSIA